MSNNILFGRRNQIVGNAVGMKTERGIRIGKNVAKFRKAAGLSQAELAKAIGAKSQNTIAAIETGNTDKTRHLNDIARVLRVSVADLDPESQGEETVTIPGSQLIGGPDLPVYGSVEAGEGEIVVSNDPISRIKRPLPLQNIRGGYGVMVKGESMVPLVRPGDILLVNPHLPAQFEDICLFIHDEDGEFRATVKEYRGQTADHWKVRRYSPKQRDFTLSKREWHKCHVTVGKYNRR